MKWNITIGAPGEFFRAIEDIVVNVAHESPLGYFTPKEVTQPTLKSTGIPNVAEFYGTLRTDTPYDKRRWNFVIAGLVLIVLSIGFGIVIPRSGAIGTQFLISFGIYTA